MFKMKNNKQNKIVVSELSGRKINFHDAVPIALIRPTITKLIEKKQPNLSHNGFITKEELEDFREEYIQQVLETERGEISKLDEEVMDSLVKHETLTKNINAQFERRLTMGEKLSDKIAGFGGSWRFIIIFTLIVFIWIIINAIALIGRAFDPYPFILLNLILSCLAALQAPVIMMSQNRKDAKDRLRAEHDYKINLKAELEIRHLHEKIDHLTRHQWQRLLEIQQLQLDLMEEREFKFYKRRKKAKHIC